MLCPRLPPADGSGCGARSFSHCQPIRSVRGDDARPLRDRVSGLQRRPELDALSLSLQAAGPVRSRRASMRRTSRASIGTCGSHHWATGAKIPLSPAPKSGCCRTVATCLQLFAGNPFPDAPPKQVRAVLWQYWFTSLAEKRRTGMWWRRELLGLYAPVLQIGPDGKLQVVQWPAPLPPHG